MTDKKQKNENSFDFKRRALWSIAFVLLAALSVWAIVSGTKDFSFGEFVKFIKTADPVWIGIAVLSMLCFIIFEGLALLYICRSFGYGRGIRRGFVYSAADIYFSAITPSATGGQPASALFMIKDGIPGMFVTVALVANLAMYTASLVAAGLLALVLSPSMFLNFGTVSKLLVSIGIVIQTALLLFIVMLLFKKGVMHGLCRGFLKLLAKLHIVKNPADKFEALKKKMDEYSSHAALLSGKGRVLAVVFVLNFIQRIAQISVPAYIHLASGGSFKQAYDIFIAQIYVTVGAYSVPIPGAMGITDYMMVDAYEDLAVANPAFLELFSRTLSFYVCVLICGITILVSWCSLSKRRVKK